MTNQNELNINQEVRIRILEEISKDIKSELKELRKDMHSQFLWIIGTLLTLFGGVILHSAKLI